MKKTSQKVMAAIATLVLAGSMTAIAPVAMATEATSGGDTATEEDTRTFVDSAGREVQIPTEITRVAVSGPLAQQIMLTFDPSLLVGLASSLSDDETAIYGEDVASMEVFGQIYGGKGDFNREAVAAADPQLVIDIGEAKSSIVEDLDGIQEQIAIPCIHVEATLATYDEVYTTLGELFGEPERGAELAEYCANVYQTVTEGIATIPEDERVQALYTLGDAGLNVMAATSYQAGVIDMCATNVAVLDEFSGSGMGTEVSMDQIMMWDPELIVFADGSIYDTVADDPTWSTLDAIADGNYYEAPSVPYNWLSGPPSVNQVMGLQWFAKLCYPDVFDYEIMDVAQSYYQIFYGVDLPEDLVADIEAKATPAIALADAA